MQHRRGKEREKKAQLEKMLRINCVLKTQLEMIDKLTTTEFLIEKKHCARSYARCRGEYDTKVSEK